MAHATTVTRQQFLDTFVRPTATFLGLDQPGPLGAPSPYALFSGAVLAVPDLDGAGPFDPDKIPLTLPTWLLPSSGSSAPPSAPAAPIADPEAVLASIANALKKAEGLLNDANLAVLQGSISIKLQVDIGGVAGAETEFTLQIGPVPTD